MHMYAVTAGGPWRLARPPRPHPAPDAKPASQGTRLRSTPVPRLAYSTAGDHTTSSFIKNELLRFYLLLFSVADALG